jgi:pimeloyl-ACP methyl ester carboxylesterase
MSTFILVPGAGGDSWYWHLVVPRLRALGHAVATPDLPYGDESAGLVEHADAIVGSVDADAGPVILVAQSMGAFSAPLACARLDVELLVLVCPMIPAPGESAGAWWSSTGQTEAQRALDRSEGRDPDAPFDLETVFLHDVPEAVVQGLLARGEPPESERPFVEPWPLTAWPDVPTRVLVGGRDRLFPLGFARRLARERVGVEPDVIDAGHLAALARPHELADQLERYRAEAGAERIGG